MPRGNAYGELIPDATIVNAGTLPVRSHPNGDGPRMWDLRNYRDTDFGLDAGDTFEPGDASAPDDVDLSQPHIMTVLGPILPEELGICLPHEYILCDPLAASEKDPDFRLDRIDLASEELESFLTLGGRAMVDASTRDYGRDLKGLRTVAQRVPIHIIATTGRHRHLHSYRMDDALDRDALAAEIRSDIRGDIKPGVIMFGTSLDEITPVEATAARAAARVAVETGYPVSSRTEAGTMAHEQLALVEAEGLDGGRVIIGGLNRCLDPPFLITIAARGAWLSFDQIGNESAEADALTASTLVELAEAGYEDQLLVSQGVARRSRLVSYGGQPGWTYLLERFAITLMEAGAEAPLVRRLLIDNPARALAIVPA